MRLASVLQSSMYHPIIDSEHAELTPVQVRRHGSCTTNVSRPQLSRNERPAYEASGQHLHGADAAIFERVRAEIAAVHGGALTAAGVAEKKWTIEARTK